MLIDVVMESDILGLNEVVVTALGISREKKILRICYTGSKRGRNFQS